MSSSERPRVFLDVTIDKESSGRLVIELFTDHAPKTCANFRQFCTGYNDTSYADCPIHRVIDDFMIQGGDIAQGDGTGVLSIYGGDFEDENLNWRQLDAIGLVCSANRGKDTNGRVVSTQIGQYDIAGAHAYTIRFFITLEPQPHLNGKHTIFGHVVAGSDVLQKIAKVPVDDDDRPTVPVVISRCGELERKRKRQADGIQDRPISKDRGRPRKSDDVDVEMRSPDVQAGPKGRRQSDNTVDEGLRGRPRARSGQRAATVVEDDTSSNQHSPVRVHKRKRSPSPSRHPKPESQETDRHHDRRRRRSLPNQYGGEDGGDTERHNDRRGDKYRADRQYDSYRSNHRSDGRRPDRRDHDRWRPHQREQDSDRGYDSGRLGNDEEDGSSSVKFKGRGVMKYREPDRL